MSSKIVHEDSAVDSGLIDSRILLGMTNKPGVYRMLDQRGNIIYVGKAKNLKKRVSSYFTTTSQSPKTRAMVAQIMDIEVIVTHTEKEALILESNQIKKLKPRYNVWFRDSKSYPYIYLATNQAFPRLNYHRGAKRLQGRYFGPYPNSGAVRKTLNLVKKLFMVRQCDDSFFANRQRPCLEYQIKRCSAPCTGLISQQHYQQNIEHTIMFLQGQSDEVIDSLIKPMQQASEAQQYEQAARYRDQISELRKLHESQYMSVEKGNIDVVAASVQEGVACVLVLYIRNGLNQGIRTYFPSNYLSASDLCGVTDMSTESAILEAFLAQFYLQYNLVNEQIPKEIVLSHKITNSPSLQAAISTQADRQVKIKQVSRGHRAKWINMALENANIAIAQYLNSKQTQQKRMQQLAQLLKLDNALHRIECFDISHTSGEATVAACVVFDNGVPTKTDYRRYNISGIKAGDDYAAMGQAIMRRYQRINKEHGKIPNIILLDGGKGQVSTARKMLNTLQLQQPLLIGVAKGPDRKVGLETLIIERDDQQIHLPQDSPAFHLLQQIRDEAHRFAITGHRQRRSKVRKRSLLEDIEGIGQKRRHNLLSHFGGLQGIMSAGVDDLNKVSGISKNLAHKLYDTLHNL